MTFAISDVEAIIARTSHSLHFVTAKAVKSQVNIQGLFCQRVLGD